MLNWGHFFGGQVTCEFPFIVLMIIGYCFAKLGAITFDGSIVLAKICIEVFLPCYIFIQICQATTVDYLIQNGAVIVSQCFLMLIAFTASYIYAILMKVDVRYKWTLIAIATISEIKFMNYLLVGSFCYHVDDKSKVETAYCSKLNYFNYSHMFFQNIISWYLFFIAIRKDREHWRTIVEVGRDIAKAYETELVIDSSSSSEDEQEEEKLAIIKRKSKDNSGKNGVKNKELKEDKEANQQYGTSQYSKDCKYELTKGYKETEQGFLKNITPEDDKDNNKVHEDYFGEKDEHSVNNSRDNGNNKGKVKPQEIELQEKDDSKIKSNNKKDNSKDNFNSKDNKDKMEAEEKKQRKRELRELRKQEEQKLKREKQIMYDLYQQNMEVPKDNNTLHAPPEFFEEVEKYYCAHLQKTKADIKPWWYKLSYVLLGPCQIALFTGFIVGFISVVRTWIFNTTGAQFIFYDTINSIGNAHLVVNYLLIGANLHLLKQHEFTFRFRKIDHFALLILKCLILPFLGLLYVFIAKEVNNINRVVLFNAYIQWITPTSIDIITMVQAKEINSKDTAISVFIQWVWLLCISTFAVNSPMLRILGF